MSTHHERLIPAQGDLSQDPVAVITGGSAGLGLALVRALAGDGWRVVTDARDAARLAEATAPLAGVSAIAGDVRDPTHQAALIKAVHALGRLDLLVHNASELGPMRPLADVVPQEFAAVLSTNLVAPLALTQRLLPWLLESHGILIGLSSDAAVEHYQTWGTYAAGKAALDHLILTFGAETGARAYALDPGDMRTQMHQRAFPGEDISDRPLPDTVVPQLRSLIGGDLPSGRYRAADIASTLVEVGP